MSTQIAHPPVKGLMSTKIRQMESHPHIKEPAILLQTVLNAADVPTSSESSIVLDSSTNTRGGAGRGT